MKRQKQLNVRYRRWMCIMTAGLLFLALTMGCSLFNRVPDYVGTWVTEVEFTYGSYTFYYRVTLELNEDETYALYYEGKSSEDGEYVFSQGNASSTGTYQVEDDTVTLTIMQTEYYDGAWQQTLDPYETDTATYSLDGDTLTVYTDNNDDGDTADEMETLTFTRSE